MAKAAARITTLAMPYVRFPFLEVTQDAAESVAAFDQAASGERTNRYEQRGCTTGAGMRFRCMRLRES